MTFEERVKTQLGNLLWVNLQQAHKIDEQAEQLAGLMLTPASPLPPVNERPAKPKPNGKETTA